MMNSQPKLELLISRKQIETAVKKLAREIVRDYEGKNPLLIGILKGSFVFLADLIRSLDIPLEVEFVRIASYGDGVRSSGIINMVNDPVARIRERHILVVEDIVDTGLTTAFLKKYLIKQKPASLKICTLADKPSRRRTAIDIDYLGITVPDLFIVGYGLDWDEKYRNLPDIYVIQEPE